MYKDVKQPSVAVKISPVPFRSILPLSLSDISLSRHERQQSSILIGRHEFLSISMVLTTILDLLSMISEITSSSSIHALIQKHPFLQNMAASPSIQQSVTSKHHKFLSLHTTIIAIQTCYFVQTLSLERFQPMTCNYLMANNQCIPSIHAQNATIISLLLCDQLYLSIKSPITTS